MVGRIMAPVMAIIIIQLMEAGLRLIRRIQMLCIIAMVRIRILQFIFSHMRHQTIMELILVIAITATITIIRDMVIMLVTIIPVIILIHME